MRFISSFEIINYSNLNIKGLKPTIKTFPDSESKVILENLEKSDTYIILVQTDQNPTQMIFVTAMIVDIVKQQNPKNIVVIHPWLSFSRQDKRFLESESKTIDILLNFYCAIGCTDLVSFDIHSIEFRKPGIQYFTSSFGQLRIHNVNVIQHLIPNNIDEMTIISPTGVDEPFLTPLREKGYPIVYFKKEKYCKNCNKPLQFCTCEGQVIKDVRIRFEGKLIDQQVFMCDDIIAGGGTILESLKFLQTTGITKPLNIAATHGFFNNLNNAKEIIEIVNKSGGTILVTNSVSIHLDIKSSIKIYDLSSITLNYIKKHWD